MGRRTVVAVVSALVLAGGATLGSSPSGASHQPAQAGPAQAGPAQAGPAQVDPAQVDPAGSSFQPLDTPARLLDTRDGASTVDGAFAGGGEVEPGATTEITVIGRAGVPADADAVAVNLTAVEAADAGYVTAYPCGEPLPNASNLNHAAGQTIAAGALVRVGDDGRICLYASERTHLLADVTGYFPAGGPGDGYDALGSPQRLLDTRDGGSTTDDAFAAIGPLDADSTLELDVAGRGGLASPLATAVLTVTVTDPAAAGYVTVHPCDGARPNASSVNFAEGQTIANMAVTRVDPDGQVCLFASAGAHVIVDAAGSLSEAAYEPLQQPARIVDTRSPDSTVDGELAGGGVRPESSTLRVAVAGRAGLPADAGAAVLNVTAVEARSDGFTTVHPAGVDRPATSSVDFSNLNVAAGQTVANTVVAGLGTDGAVCIFSDTSAHYVVDVVGWLPGAPAPVTDGDCPAPPLFPTYRMVALYGTDASELMGALGEQPPEQAAERLAEVIEPWQAGDRPVLGTFELIATIASASPGDDGMYRIVSSEEHVQRYLDVARANGYYLLLDIQPGRSDFLTEVQRYERFLREPDVGVALDPEWRVGPGEVPGQLVGQVSAAEVNEVAEYVAGIVAEEGLPQKLFVVHQFQDRMITDRDQLIAPPELAVNIHMDGFGTRQQKLDTYSVTRADPPLSNGFKLFYDEDIDMFAPSEVLQLDPVPDFISYQ